MTTPNKRDQSAQLEGLVDQYCTLNQEQFRDIVNLGAMSKTLGDKFTKARVYAQSDSIEISRLKARVDRLAYEISRRRNELAGLASQVSAAYDQMIAPLEPRLRRRFQIFKPFYMRQMRAEKTSKDVEQIAGAKYLEITQMVRATLLVDSPDAKAQLEAAILAKMPTP